MMKYNADDIVVKKWDHLRQIPDGKWNRIWDIQLKQAIPSTINVDDLSKSLSHEDFNVKVEASEKNHVTISVTTERWGWEDELYFETYRMLDDVEHFLGRIDTIQGESREKWSMWLGRRNKSI